MKPQRGEPIGERNGIPIYKPLDRKTPLRPREPKPQRKSKPLRVSEQLLRQSVEVVKRRARGRCERCMIRADSHTHHRLPRRAGGSARNVMVNLPANLLRLCSGCHADVESYRQRAYTLGLLLHSGEDPRLVPVTLGLEPFTHKFLLDDDGGMTVYEEAAA